MKKSKAEVKSIVENEGIGYAVTSYMSESCIEDPELAKAWKEAREALERIEALLEDDKVEGRG
jgi:hypothetical protein